ncbi:MAG: hypothetical protein HY556_09505 [Euryarchaeota archaeon]|nr:hypothetical protein [Euryarchaeota archaeon]
MGLYWNPIGAVGLAVTATTWLIAAVIYFARPGRSQNRRLATLLAVEGFGWSGGAGLIYVVDDPAQAYAAQAITTVVLAAIPFLYVAFIATLETPLVRPLRNPYVSWALWAGAMLASAFVLVNMSHFVAGVAPVPYSKWESVSGDWGAYGVVGYALVATSLLGLIAALATWRGAAQGSATRARAAAYAVAFGIRDFNFGITFSGIQDLLFPEIVPGFGQAMFEVVALLSFLVLGYAIVRHQLFDVDLKLKWTIKQSTVATAFIAVFFVVSEVAQSVFQSSLGSIAGIIAAGALVFALAPLQRAADRVASAAMPGVKDTSEYLAYRKVEVYRATVEEILVDRAITEKERSILNRLRDKLELGDDVAKAIERDAAAAKGAA